MRKKYLILGFIFFIILITALSFKNEILNKKKIEFTNKKEILNKKKIEFTKISQYARKLEDPILDKNIETSSIPISLHFFEIAKKEASFPVEGGALGLVNENLIIMDRFGQFYLFKKDYLQKLKIKLPNRLNEYILHSKANNLNGSAFRAHSFAYDAINSTIYAAYTSYLNEDSNRLEVAAIKIDPVKIIQISEPEIIFKTKSVGFDPISLAGGGKILLNNNTLFISIGYSGIEDKADAQNILSLFGKVYSYDINSKKLNLYSLGHRNIQGMVIHRNSLYSVEHGPQGGDEINKLELNGNYGWPYRSFGTEYGKYQDIDKREDYKKKFIDPFYAFVPSVGISSILSVKNFDNSWDGDFLVGSLKAQTIFRLKNTKNRILFSEPIWIGHRIRDMVQFEKSFFALTDDSLIIKINLNQNLLSKNIKNSGLAEKFYSLKKCLACHHFEQTNPSHIAPSLSFVNNRKIANDNFAKYSPSLKGKKGFWSDENLYLYLKNPQKFSPGTTMPNMNLTDEEIRNIINHLKNLGA